MNFIEPTDRELVKKIVQGTSTAPANVVGERAATLGREAIDKVRGDSFSEDMAMTTLMEVIMYAKAGKPWKSHMQILRRALQEAPITKAMIADALKEPGDAVQGN